MITNVDDVVKDYRGRFLSGGWPNPDVNFAIIERWIRSLPFSFTVTEVTPVAQIAPSVTVSTQIQKPKGRPKKIVTEDKIVV